jgi:hypothetical protein
MRRILQLAVLLVCVSVALPAMSASFFSDESERGTIQGSVNFCGKGGVDGMQVYIPGLPFVVITGDDGRFQLPDLPEGKYNVHYRLGARLLNRNLGVRVLPKQVTDLAVISFCDSELAASKPQTAMPVMPTSGEATPAPSAGGAQPVNADCGNDPACQDADGDGVVAAQDCDDNDAKIRPGAIESCDGKDNNCNGQVDENAMVLVMHGIGFCQNGKVAVQSCKEGFSDCDGDARNGCEVDINNDMEHCGGCNEECTPTEICVAGGCE